MNYLKLHYLDEADMHHVHVIVEWSDEMELDYLSGVCKQGSTWTIHGWNRH